MKKYFTTAIIAIFAATTSGCTILENIIGKKNSTTINGAEATKVEKSNRNELADKIAQNNQQSQDRTMRPVVVLPSAQPDSVTIETNIDKAKLKPTVTSISGLERFIGGNWTIVQVDSITIDRDEDMPYIVFVPSEGRFYANNGCNTLNGSYTMDGEYIAFHNVLTTMRYCADVNFDHQINTIIADDVSTRIIISEIGSETILEFVSSSAKSLMKLRRGNLEFLNGQWDITAVGGLDELKAPATVFFDLTDLKLHGNTGCNFINGEIYLDHRMPNAIDFSQIITTLRACLYPEQQTAILVGLEETASAISDGADKVLLLDSKGRIMLELKKSFSTNQ